MKYVITPILIAVRIPQENETGNVNRKFGYTNKRTIDVASLSVILRVNDNSSHNKITKYILSSPFLLVSIVIIQKLCCFLYAEIVT